MPIGRITCNKPTPWYTSPTMRFKNTCFYCKSEFQTNIHNQQFCNAECRNSIDEFICPESKTNARFVILARDNFKCAYCGAPLS